MHPFVGKQSETPFYMQFQLFPFIYPHKKHRHTKNRIRKYYAHSHSREPIINLVAILEFRAKHIELNRERLQAPSRALAFREKALDSTLIARIVEHASVSVQCSSVLCRQVSLAAVNQIDVIHEVLNDCKKIH